MMDLNLLSIDLRKKDTLNDLTVYLFGSANTDKNPGDIDLLIVYGNRYTIEDMLILRKKLFDFIMATYKKSAHVLLFSKDEANKNDFIVHEKCRLLHETLQ